MLILLGKLRLLVSLPVSVMASSPPRTPTTPTTPAPSGGSSESVGSAHRLKYTMEMDLILLRQVRSHGNPFVRGSDVFEAVAKELVSAEPRLFDALTKKGVRDRTMKLLDHHGKGDAWKKKQ